MEGPQGPYGGRWHGGLLAACRRWSLVLVLTASGAAQADSREERLHAAVDRLSPGTPRLNDDAVAAALGTEGPGVEGPGADAELLLALAWYESHFDPAVRTGHVCGALQVVPEDVGERDHADACRRWSQDAWQGFEAGAREVRLWLRYARGDLLVALRGRACGWSGLTRSCGKDDWVRRVLGLAARLRRWRPPPAPAIAALRLQDDSCVR